MASDSDDPRRAGGEREPHVVGLLEPARDLERHRDPRRDGAHGLEVRRPRLLRPVEVDEVEDPGALGDELLGDHAPAGRSGVPVPAAAPGQYTTRERPASTSIAGITSIRSGSLAAQQPAVEADRAASRCASSVSWNAR